MDAGVPKKWRGGHESGRLFLGALRGHSRDNRARATPAKCHRRFSTRRRYAWRKGWARQMRLANACVHETCRGSAHAPQPRGRCQVDGPAL